MALHKVFQNILSIFSKATSKERKIENIIKDHFDNHNKVSKKVSKVSHKEMAYSSEREHLDNNHRLDKFYVSGKLELKVLTHFENGMAVSKSYYDNEGNEITDPERISQIETFSFHRKENV